MSAPRAHVLMPAARAFLTRVAAMKRDGTLIRSL
jgi:hypothetical protein